MSKAKTFDIVDEILNSDEMQLISDIENDVVQGFLHDCGGETIIPCGLGNFAVDFDPCEV